MDYEITLNQDQQYVVSAGGQRRGFVFRTEAAARLYAEQDAVMTAAFGADGARRYSSTSPSC